MDSNFNVAAALSAYTGYLLCDSFSDVQEYIERVLGRPVFTHQITKPEIGDEIRRVMRANGDFERATKALRALEALEV